MLRKSFCAAGITLAFFGMSSPLIAKECRERPQELTTLCSYSPEFDEFRFDLIVMQDLSELALCLDHARDIQLSFDAAAKALWRAGADDNNGQYGRISGMLSDIDELRLYISEWKFNKYECEKRPINAIFSSRAWTILIMRTNDGKSWTYKTGYSR